MRIFILFFLIFISFFSCSEQPKTNTLNTNLEAIEEVIEDIDDYRINKDFTIQFVDQPEKSFVNVQTEMGEIILYSYIYEKSPTEIFMVAHSDYPMDSIGQANHKELLNSAVNGAMKNMDITEKETEYEIDINGYPGKYIKANNGNLFVVYEMYMVNNRLYQIAILQTGSYPDKKIEENFMSGFKLI